MKERFESISKKSSSVETTGGLTEKRHTITIISIWMHTKTYRIRGRSHTGHILVFKNSKTGAECRRAELFLIRQYKGVLCIFYALSFISIHASIKIALAFYLRFTRFSAFLWKIFQNSTLAYYLCYFCSMHVVWQISFMPGLHKWPFTFAKMCIKLYPTMQCNFELNLLNYTSTEVMWQCSIKQSEY